MSHLREVISTEGHIDGKLAKEIEYTFYGKVADMQQLSRAVSKEEHEQWLIPVDTDLDSKLRIRCINNMRWIACTKVKREGMVGWEEVECDISQDMYNHLREMGVGGMKKTRYIFKIEGTTNVWEMDVFKDSFGHDHPWVKLDLEVSKEGEEIPGLPVDFAEFIAAQPQQQSDHEKNFIEKLWKAEWTSLDPAQKTKGNEPK